MIAGEKYDLVFDAPWCRLKDLAAEGFYEDLARYFDNPEYPGLQAAFSEKDYRKMSLRWPLCW
jgi:hypothetical protein